MPHKRDCQTDISQGYKEKQQEGQRTRQRHQVRAPDLRPDQGNAAQNERHAQREPKRKVSDFRNHI